MKRISIPATRPYEVFLGSGLLASCGELLSPLCRGRRAVIVSGPRVYPLYGAAVEASLQESGFETAVFLHPDGEPAKTLEVYAQLMDFLCERHLGRSDLLIALGGGVSGDLCGFAAATYQRGTGYVQLPTTLLAMVDSSVGGKTALNLRGGKNQVGAFYSPLAVLADTDTLSTLPPEQWLSGLGEVVKYALLGDAELFSRLEAGCDPGNEAILERCIAMKRDIVARDEFDTGERQMLNLGHSFGHAIEQCSGFTLPHGIAVAAGLALIARGSNHQGFFPDSALERLLALLWKLGLPSDSEYDKAALLSAAAADKKRSGGSITLVLPREIGRCELKTVPFERLEDFLN